MDTSKILNDLRAEKDRIQKAIDALEALAPTATQTTPGTQSPAKARAGRKSSGAKQVSASTTGRRTMSPAARRKISEAQKALWASKKAAQPQATAKQTAPKQVAAKEATGKRHLSPAARRAMSQAAKKRWTEKKKAAAKAV